MTCYGNQCEVIMRKLLASPWTYPGFVDSGAHLRSIVQYNFPLRFLKYVRDVELVGEFFMELGKVVRCCSGELVDFIGIDVGYLCDVS